MAVVSGSTANSSGLIHHNPCKLPFRIQRFSGSRLHYVNCISVQSAKLLKTRILYSGSKHFGSKFVISAAGGHHNQFRFDSDLPKEHSLLSLVKEAFWAVKSVLAFLAEQPKQLRYIEWPAFQSTLKTAILTLVLVALLIIVLASVDSVLSYLLALLLRRSS